MFSLSCNFILNIGKITYSSENLVTESYKPRRNNLHAMATETYTRHGNRNIYTPWLKKHINAMAIETYTPWQQKYMHGMATETYTS